MSFSTKQWIILAYSVNICIYTALLNGCSEANQRVKKCTILTEMYNIKGWLDEFGAGIHNHSNPHIFKFVKDENGTCRMFYKHWRHSEWEPTAKPGLVLLKVRLKYIHIYIYIYIHVHTCMFMFHAVIVLLYANN